VYCLKAGIRNRYRSILGDRYTEGSNEAVLFALAEYQATEASQ